MTIEHTLTHLQGMYRVLPFRPWICDHYPPGIYRDDGRDQRQSQRYIIEHTLTWERQLPSQLPSF